MDPNFFVLRHDHDCINFRLNLVKGHHKCRCISQEWQPKKEKKALINPGFKWVGRCIMEGRGGGGGGGGAGGVAHVMSRGLGAVTL